MVRWMVLVFAGCSMVAAAAADCDLQCRGVQIVDTFLSRLSGGNLDLTDGVKLVNTGGPDPPAGRSVASSFLSRLRRFLTTYELQVKLPEMLPRQSDVSSTLRSALDYLNEIQSGEEETPRKGGGGGGLGGKKGGGGAMLMMATMMGGTMAALGFGAVGMLAMKALTVSAMALMLSAVIGLKKLMSKGDDDGGHSVSYIPVHHGGGHRRRRSLHSHPYRAHHPR